MTFDIHRCRQLIIKDLVEQHRFYLGFCGASFTLFLGCLMMMHIVSDAGFLVLASVAFYALSSYAASATFDCVNSKSRRLQFLLIPASMIEKYVSRLVITMLLPLVVMLITFLLADVICMLLFYLLQGRVLLGMVDASSFVTTYLSNSREYLLDLYTLVLSVFFNSSLFLLGSALYRKGAFIKTILTGVGVLLLVIFVGFGMIHFDGADTTRYHYEFYDHLDILLMTLIIPCIIIACFYLMKRTYLDGYKLLRT